jgi:hypothetical protein
MPDDALMIILILSLRSIIADGMLAMIARVSNIRFFVQKNGV